VTDTTIQNIEGVLMVALLVCVLFVYLVVRFRRTRPGLAIALPVAVALALRMLAIAGINATGLETTLRGGDEDTFIAIGRYLAQQPLGHGFFPHGPYQLQTVIFALQFKLGFLTVGALRITQVGIAWLGMILIIVSVHDLASPRAARLAAWLLAFEPTSIFFNSELHKEPLMELAAGLVVFGGTMLWKRLDLRGLLICGVGGLIGVETRSYAGWFLVTASVMLLLHAALRAMTRQRALAAMPIIYAIVIAGFVVGPVLLAETSGKNLRVLQESQQANASGAGQGAGANSSNLALEQVNFSSRGAILTHLPTRMRELILQPYPWQLQDASQRFGAIGTLAAYAILLLLIRYAWLSRGHVFPRAAPLLWPLLFMLVAYSLAVGNAGTGFRYRSHLVTLAICGVVVLREHVLLAREREREPGPRPGPGPSEAPEAPVGVDRTPIAPVAL
jgi:hypothetical protein